MDLDGDAAHVLSAGLAGHLRYWDRTGKLLLDQTGAVVWGARFAPDGRSVATAASELGSQGRVMIRSLAPEMRDAAAIAAVLDCWVRFRLVDQRLVPHAPRCVTDLDDPR